MIKKSVVRSINHFFCLRGAVLQRLMSKNALYQGQLPILEYIIDHAGCMQSEIAEALQISAASIAASTKRLQKAGFLEKKTDANNLRCNQLFITPLGLMAAQNTRQQLDVFEQHCFRDFTDSELNMLENFAKRMINNMTDYQKQHRDAKNEAPF